jgi:hypothetical protein
MSNINRNIEYKDLQGNNWHLMTNDTSIEIKCNREARTYEIDNIIKVEHDHEYIFLYEYGTKCFYQVKFEEDKFLVIDKFNADGEHIENIGSHVFGE